MHNLGNVYSFEVVRTLKKKSFWISVLAFPLMMALLFGVVYFANKTTDEKTSEMAKQKFSIIMTDESQVVRPELISQLAIKATSDKQAAIAQVTSGAVDAYFYYPKDLTTQKVEVYAKEAGIFENDKYQSVAKMLLDQSAAQTVSGNVRSILTKQFSVTSQTYQNGTRYDGFSKMIAPGLFLVLFYFIIVMFGNQALVSTTEEKENRVIEMILTTVDSRTLVIGKILSIITLALLQVILLIIPALLIYLNFHSQLSMPALDLSHLEFDAGRIAIATILFISSFMMFTALLVTVGAAAPTAKDAGGFFGALMLLLFGPLYAAPLFISAPESLLVKVLSFFPLTSPIPLLLRNAIGNLQPWEIIIGVAILVAFTIIMLNIAVRVFRYGAVEYSKRLSFGTVFGKRAKPTVR